jgi:hypothetical protein
MSAAPEVTDATAFEQKSLGIQVVLTVVTGGLYALYWFYSTASQLDESTNQDLTPILGVIPVVNLISAWQISSAAESVTDQSNIVMFVLFLVLAPVSWYWIQSGMNDVASS